MKHHLHKKSILKNTVKVGGITFISRILGIIREALLAQYFGIGAVSDAFIAAFRIPNFLRHIFAEGAMSASFIPAFVKSVKEDKMDEANGLMTLSFLFFQSIVLLLCGFVFLKTEWVVRFVAPGFNAEQIHYAIPFMRVLFPFLLFISSSALLAGALQSVNHFFVPAFGTPLWNMVYVATLLLCLWYDLPPLVVCSGVIFGAFIQFLLHLLVYFRLKFSFGKVTSGAKKAFKNVLTKFLPCLFGVSIVELNLLIGGQIASFLPKGSVTILHYGSRYMNIPLGMFAVALSSVLLPHFSRVVLYAPKRLSFYLLEVAKFVSWAIIPATFFLMFISQPLFANLLLKGKATDEQLFQAGMVLMIYLSGLLFLCLNKILLSMFYALKDTTATTIAAAISALVNIGGDLIGMYYFGAYGIAAANTIAGITMTIACLIFLKKRHGFLFYIKEYALFLGKYFLQLCLASVIFVLSYQGLFFALAQTAWRDFFMYSYGYWCAVLPLGGLVMLLSFSTRHLFGLKIYFLARE